MEETAMASYTPTPEQLKNVFNNSMQYEIMYAFGVPAHYPYDYCLWETINLTRLAHARLLYKFLETPAASRRYPDDVVSEDFDFPARPGLLSNADWERLNKDLFHFSYGRLRHPPGEKVWPPHLLGNLLEPMLGFMRHIRDIRKDLFDPPGDLQAWCTLIMILESGTELQIAAHYVDDYFRYSLMPGRTLPNGKPTYTALLPVFPVAPPT